MTNDKFPMTNQIQMTNDKNKYNLAKRTAEFGSEIIVFVKAIKEKCRKLWQEAHELTLIFSAIVKRKY